jgi:hypothetical protein
MSTRVLHLSSRSETIEADIPCSLGVIKGLR